MSTDPFSDVLRLTEAEAVVAGSLPAGSALHVVADPGVPVRELAAVIAARLGLGPAVARNAEHFEWFAAFRALDNPSSSAITQQLTGWRPTHPGLLNDVRGPAYAPAPAA